MQLTKEKAIQLIHIAKQQLRMDELSYRMLLKNITGKTSSTKMTISELVKVLTEMEAKGFRTTVKNGYRYSPRTKKAVVKSNITHKIRAIWIEMGKQGMLRDGSERALNAWVRGVVNPIYQKRGQNIQILNVGALDNQMASLVLEMLKRWQARGGL